MKTRSSSACSGRCIVSPSLHQSRGHETSVQSNRPQPILQDHVAGGRQPLRIPRQLRRLEHIARERREGPKKADEHDEACIATERPACLEYAKERDRKSTRLNSSHLVISY